jgi:hypothetical protein
VNAGVQNGDPGATTEAVYQATKAEATTVLKSGLDSYADHLRAQQELRANQPLGTYSFLTPRSPPKNRISALPALYPPPSSGIVTSLFTVQQIADNMSVPDPPMGSSFSDINFFRVNYSWERLTGGGAKGRPVTLSFTSPDFSFTTSNNAIFAPTVVDSGPIYNLEFRKTNSLAFSFPPNSTFLVKTFGGVTGLPTGEYTFSITNISGDQIEVSSGYSKGSPVNTPLPTATPSPGGTVHIHLNIDGKGNDTIFLENH